jgi:D-alanyl-D-alanine carboxypeptidase
MKSVISALIIPILFNFTISAQSINKAKLDSLFETLSEHNLAMGSLTISVNGIVQYRKVIGYAYMDDYRKIPADFDTKYRIGSVSKMFTAVMIFQLVDEKKVNLDETIDKYFSKLPNANKITVGNLLNHRSGLHTYTEGTNYVNWMDKPKTHEELLKIISEKNVDFEPDTRAEYSNTNYLLLSYIIEKVERMSYAAVLNKRIIAKIGLPNTYYGRKIDSSLHESTSYKYYDNKWAKEKETDMSIHSGAGSIVSTPTDLVKFISALFSNKLVSVKSLGQMKALVDDYGMGMFPFRFDGKLGYGHGGKIESFSASLQYFPEKKLAIAYCTNGQVYAKDDILKVVQSICFNVPLTIPRFRYITLNPDDLEKLVGKYSSSQMPIKVVVTKENSRLLLETKDQLFMLEPIGKNYFMQTQYGFFFEFYPEKQELLIKETDNVYYLKKER